MIKQSSFATNADSDNDNINNIVNFREINKQVFKNSNENNIELLKIASSIISQKDIDAGIDSACNALRVIYHKIATIVNADENGQPLYKQKNIDLSTIFCDEYIVCLEDGIKLKVLKRHLRTKYNMSIEEYRIKWGLPMNFPTVCKNYSKRRRDIASETSEVRVDKMKLKKKKKN